MLRTMAYVATVVVLIVLVAAKQGWFGDADHTMRNETALPVIVPVPAGTITESATSSSTKPYGSNDATSAPSPASSSVLMRSSGPEFAKSVTTRQSNSNEAQISTAIDTDVDPTEVIGRPFPVSISVESSCRSDGELCNEILLPLSTMAQEPRDPAWASNTEAKLRALIVTVQTTTSCRLPEFSAMLVAIATMTRSSGDGFEGSGAGVGRWWYTA